MSGVRYILRTMGWKPAPPKGEAFWVFGYREPKAGDSPDLEVEDKKGQRRVRLSRPAASYEDAQDEARTLLLMGAEFVDVVQNDRRIH